ncbi:MAG TPA: helix-turn-helix domain-containing protein [Pseudonocardia sp.]
MLAAAREAFAESGFAVPLDVIAARAGVGPGTVYRHFPTKEALFEAVTLARVQDLVEVARKGAESADPGASLDAFLARLAAEATAKRDLPEALGGVGAEAVALARTELHSALDVLLAHARTAGAVRAGIGASELLVLIKGLLQAVQENPDPGLPARLVAVVRDGLRPPPDETERQPRRGV